MRICVLLIDFKTASIDIEFRRVIYARDYDSIAIRHGRDLCYDGKSVYYKVIYHHICKLAPMQNST